MTTSQVPVDLHQHIQQEPDVSKLSFNKVVDLIRETYGERCIVGVVNFRDVNTRGLRDDRRYEDFTNLKGYKRQNYGDHINVGQVRIIKVQEIPAIHEGMEVHIICVGLKEEEHIEPRRNLLEVLSEIKRRNLISIIDHPFARAGIGRYLAKDKTLEKKVLSSVTGIELFNGLTERSFPFVGDGNSNKRTQEYFDSIKEEYPNLGAIVGTDGQSLKALRYASYSLLDIQTDEENFDLQLVQRLQKAIRKHRNIERDKRVPQSRYEMLKHIYGIISEEGIKHTLSRL